MSPVLQLIPTPFLPSAWRQRPRTRRLVGGAGAVLLGLAGYFLVWPHLWAWYHWRQADALLAAHEPHQAREHLELCRRVWPDSPGLFFTLGRAARRDGDTVAARAWLQKAKHHGWPAADLALEYHLIEAQTGAVRAAEGPLLALIKQDHPDKTLILEALTIGYLRLSFFDFAYMMASEWQRVAPDDWYPYYLRALVLERGQKQPLAVQDYEEVLRRKPDQYPARLAIARIYLRNRQFEDAEKVLADCLAVRPDDAEALVGMARCHRAFRRFEQAQATLERAFAQGPPSLDAVLTRGHLELDQDRPAEALPWFQKATAMDPTNLEAAQNYAATLRAAGRHEEAVKAEARRLEIETFLKKMEKLVRDLQQLPPATDEATRAREVQLRYEAGMAQLETGHEEEAASWLLSASQLDPGHEPTRQALMELERRRSERAAAQAR